MGNLTITLSPTTAITRGAKWYCSGADGWHDSGDTISVTDGSYTVSFRRAQGYVTPADLTVTVPGTYTVPYSVYQWDVNWGPPISVCLFRGQVIVGGHYMPVPEAFPSAGRIVRWSDIGAFDFLGTTANPIKNEAGFWIMPGAFDEMVMRVLEIQDGVIVYGNHSVWEMLPVKDPAPTFSFKKLCDIGIANPLSVAGNSKEHRFVDRRGFLWEIKKNQYGTLIPKRLGYSEFLSSLQDDIDIISGKGIISMSYNQDEEEWYICGEGKGYMLSDTGLTEMSKSITSMFSMQGGDTSLVPSIYYTEYPLGIYTLLDDEGWMQFETDVIDFNLSAIKTIESIELGGSLGVSNFTECMIKWRNNRGAQFRETKWKRMSPNGVGYPIVSGSDFIVCIRTMPYEGVNIDSMNISWKLSDKSSVRGNYANSPAS